MQQAPLKINGIQPNYIIFPRVNKMEVMWDYASQNDQKMAIQSKMRI